VTRNYISYPGHLKAYVALMKMEPLPYRILIPIESFRVDVPVKQCSVGGSTAQPTSAVGW
jgi:hypothetical protein